MAAQEDQIATMTGSVDLSLEPAVPSSASSNNIQNDEKLAGDAVDGVDVVDAVSEKNGHIPTVEASISTTTKKPLSFYLAFTSLLIMVFIVSLDTTTLAVALPIVARELSGTTLEAFWANISFMLAVVVMQPLYMSTSDVLGRKIPLFTAYLLFFVGSLVFALAPSMPNVILGRTLQGLGGSGLDVLNEIITADMTTLKERPLYLGIMAIPMAGGGLLGPFVGALLSQYASWRWIGWINLPLTALGFLLTVLFLKLRPLQGTFFSKVRRLDFIGLSLFTIGCAAFVLPLSWAGSMYTWISWKTLLPLLIGVLVLIIFGIYERRPKHPVLVYRLFRNRTAVTSLVGAFMHGMIMYSLITYIPPFFQAVFLETPIQSAVTMLPMNVISMVFAGLSPAAVDYSRKYLWIIWFGWACTAVGIGLFSLIGPDASIAFRDSIPVVGAAGIGVLFTVLILPMQASVLNVDDTGLAVGLLVFFRLFGALIGLALGSTIFSSVFENNLKGLGILPSSLAELGNSSEAISFIPKLRDLQSDIPSEILVKIIAVYHESFRTIWLVMVGFACVGFAFSLFTKEVAIESEELGRQRFEIL
jgi:MFS family permease